VSNLPQFVPNSFNPSVSIQAFLREIVTECTRSECVNSFGSQLKAIVLTGSMAREEASFVRKNDSLAVFGDAEFAIVFEKKSLPPPETLSTVQQRIEKDLRQRKVQCAIDLSAVPPSYFRQLPPHIFSYELKHCGHVIWGDNRILQQIPNWLPKDLLRQDAWRLLCNRMIEQLAFIGDLSETCDELTLRSTYATVKLYLDMATSYLVFARAYEPTYRGRAGKLRWLAERAPTDGNAPFPLKEFSERITDCTEWKLSGGDMRTFMRPEFWEHAIDWAHCLWRWEVIQMTNAPGNLSSSDLFDCLAQQLKFMERIRGWASAARRSGGFKSWHHWPRWARLARHTMPRYEVYRPGMELAFRLPELVGRAENTLREKIDWGKQRSCLPLNQTNQTPPSGDRSDWQVLAELVLSNYRTLLTSTRA
jgi:hypothetical protein